MIESKLNECEQELNKMKDYFDIFLYEINERKLKELKSGINKIDDLKINDNSLDKLIDGFDSKGKPLKEKAECLNSNDLEIIRRQDVPGILNEIKSEDAEDIKSFPIEEDNAILPQSNYEVNLKNKIVEIEVIRTEKEKIDSLMRECLSTTQTPNKISDAGEILDNILSSNHRYKNPMLEFIAYILLSFYVLILAIMFIQKYSSKN